MVSDCPPKLLKYVPSEHFPHTDELVAPDDKTIKRLLPGICPNESYTDRGLKKMIQLGK